MMSKNQFPSGRFVHGQQGFSNVPEELTEEQEIQIFVKQMLINRLFLGHYQERRFVEPLKSYRDVVVVSSSEYDLKKDLDTVRKRLMRFYKMPNIWIGFTGPELPGAPASHALWVKLHDLPFGQYWFQIRQVKFVDDREMVIRIKCIRPIDGGCTIPSEVKMERKEEPPEKTPENTTETDGGNVTWDKMKFQGKNVAEEVVSNVASLMTLHNAKKVICFTSVFIAACVTGLFHSVRYIGDYSLRFMREFSIFIQATTPIFLAIIEFFAKCVGGFYLLIAMLWGRSPVRPLPNQGWKPQRALPMPPKAYYGYRR